MVKESIQQEYRNFLNIYALKNVASKYMQCICQLYLRKRICMNVDRATKREINSQLQLLILIPVSQQLIEQVENQQGYRFEQCYQLSWPN